MISHRSVPAPAIHLLRKHPSPVAKVLASVWSVNGWFQTGKTRNGCVVRRLMTSKEAVVCWGAQGTFFWLVRFLADVELRLLRRAIDRLRDAELDDFRLQEV